MEVKKACTNLSVKEWIWYLMLGRAVGCHHCFLAIL